MCKPPGRSTIRWSVMDQSCAIAHCRPGIVYNDQLHFLVQRLNTCQEYFLLTLNLAFEQILIDASPGRAFFKLH